MLDTNTKRVMNKSDEVWKFIATSLSQDEINDNDAFNIILTINARFLNAWKDMHDEAKKIIRKGYIELLDEKLPVSLIKLPVKS